MNMEKKLARALRRLAEYVGGSDSPASHPCAKAWATLAEYEKARAPGNAENALIEEEEEAKARAAHAEFVAAAVRLRRFVDVSTIRPGKATAQGWETNCAWFDSAFEALSKDGR